MQHSPRAAWCKRITASLVLVTYAAGCTHMPSGEKAFETFDSCFASNLGLAALGGVGAGMLTAKLTRGTGKSTSNAIGAAAGIATATMIAMTAWRKCAAVYNTSEPVAQKTTAQPQLPANRQRGLNLDRLEVRVEGGENDPPIPEFDFSYFAADAATKDIKARFRHKVEIVRFTPDDNDKLVLADAAGAPMRDAAGNTIPLEMAARMPRERLQWVTIAEEGKDDYVEDVVIQQGARMSYRHKLQVPPRDQMPLPLPVPMRYTLTVEADGLSDRRTVDFALLPAAERPKRFTAAAGAAGGGAMRALPSPAAGATHSAKRKVSLYSAADGKRKITGSLARGARVRIEERAEVEQKGKSERWVKVAPERGAGNGGWVAESELAEIK
ncbi:hypothetical protein [Noviherbaspirillum aridicola]|uniref:SH3 domain-containing protein n=1 Tax=Noviherbaspirillum aridicola TaxID=2849687 RepID=A0ABQ4Q3J4_9BURK|nr:hypothetical protein [Noviherbaspirillum aridicola]GIZ51753.1 hypothetical protein NCCP691_17670 [Noviherbaspirillum aridicola]